MSNNRNREESDTSRANEGFKVAGILAGLVVIVLLALLLFKSCSGEEAPDTPADTSDTTQTDTTQTGPGITYDDSAVVGGWTEADADEIIAALNEKVEQGSVKLISHKRIPWKMVQPFLWDTTIFHRPSDERNSFISICTPLCGK